MKKQKSVIWITIFVFLTILPGLIYPFLERYIDSDGHENRKLQEKPALTLENYEEFPEQYEAYYNDNLPFRNQLVRLNGAIDYFIFHQPSSDRVCIGKNGWMFYCDNEDFNPVEQSLGYWDFSDDELEQIADQLVSAETVLSSRGIEFILFIAPNKETIYIDELPDYYAVKNQYTAVDHLVDYLRENTDIRVVYPKNEILNEKEKHSELCLYYKLDTHWNSTGAYVGAASLARELGTELPAFDAVAVKAESRATGDLTDMLNISIPDGDVEYEVFWEDQPETEERKWEFSKEFIYHTTSADRRKLVVRRDSYSTALAPIAAALFEDSVWIHMWEFQPQQIFDYGADVFVYETAERYVGELLDFQITLDDLGQREE